MTLLSKTESTEGENPTKKHKTGEGQHDEVLVVEQEQQEENGLHRAQTKNISTPSSSTIEDGKNSILSDHVLNGAERFANDYLKGTPYHHGVITNLCKEGFLENVLNEIKQNSTVKFKESDLFKMYQSIDFRNLIAANDNEETQGDSAEKNSNSNTGDTQSSSLQVCKELAKKMPSVMKLKQTLYSPEFRSFMERVTNLEPGTLTDEIDCAANCHAQGCHLLCHDDVIGNRKISYIIYLTDPHEDWTHKDGGQLELYDTSTINTTTTTSTDKEVVRQQVVPNPFPVKTLLPTFNTMAYFAVVPGQSFHSVQEVFGERPRLSIQGWYHAKTAPENFNDATLRRLKSTEKGEDTEGPFTKLEQPSSEQQAIENGDTKNTNQETQEGKQQDSQSPPVILTKEEKTFLSKYINDTYLTEESIQNIRQRFEEESSVQLRHFLTTKWSSQIQKLALDKDVQEKLGQQRPPSTYDTGVNEHWNAIGPSHKQRFLQYNTKEETTNETLSFDADTAHDTGAILNHIQHTLCSSPQFGKFLQCITSLDAPTGVRGRVRRFRPGLDYTVAHYGILTQTPVLDATLCFAAGKGEQPLRDDETGDLIGSEADALWESGDVGGFECYIAADDDDDDDNNDNDETKKDKSNNGTSQAGAEAEYNDDDDTQLLSVAVSNNTLSLVYRDPGTMRFVKYVSSSAPSSRWDLALEYEIPYDDTEEDLDDEDQGDIKKNDDADNN